MIVGYESDHFVPYTNEIIRALYTILIPQSVIAITLWVVILFCLIRDKHYRDPNNLLIISFGIADLMLLFISLQSSLINELDGGYGKGYKACSIEMYFLTVAYCSSGFSTVIIGVDRFLAINMDITTSCGKTLFLLSFAWGISIIFPILAIILNLPDSALLLSGVYCVPNFTSTLPTTRNWLIFAISVIFCCMIVLVFCYSMIFFKYQTAIRVRDGALNSQITSTVFKNDEKKAARKERPPAVKKLLFKCATITCCYIITWLPMDFLFLYMLITQQEPPWQFSAAATFIFELHPLLNPIILYLTDARIKVTVNEYFLAAYSFLKTKRSLS